MYIHYGRLTITGMIGSIKIDLVADPLEYVEVFVANFNTGQSLDPFSVNVLLKYCVIIRQLASQLHITLKKVHVASAIPSQ